MNPNKMHNENHGHKKTFFKKIKEMAVKTTHILKGFFPRRIKPMDQEKDKGPKF
ncbi:MAG: hypothetical protein ABIF12_01440 [bacterium]